MAFLADRRSVRTHEVLLAAFLDLMFERGYEALSVGDIAAKANVGRSTFYEHFKGKADLLKFSLRMPFGVLTDIVGVEHASASTLRLLAHFRARRKLGPVLFSWPVRPLLTRTLTEMLEKRLAAGALGAPLVARRVAALQIAEAQLALVDNWISGRAACEAAAMAEALHASTNALVKALHRPA